MRIDRVKLIAKMASNNLRTQDLATLAGVSQSTVSALRSGKSCSKNTVFHVANALGVTTDFLCKKIDLDSNNFEGDNN